MTPNRTEIGAWNGSHGQPFIVWATKWFESLVNYKLVWNPRTGIYELKDAVPEDADDTKQD
jgi:hypothetical protein